MNAQICFLSVAFQNFSLFWKKCPTKASFSEPFVMEDLTRDALDIAVCD
jgi:hypothetical protein